MIIRDGDHAFVLQEGVGFGFNLTQITKVSIESAARAYGGPKTEMFVCIFSSGHCTNMTMSIDEVRQLFSDSVWMKVVPK